MVFDWDDHGEQHNQNAMSWMVALKAINPDFKATLFAVPAWGSDTFWNSHPDWIELAMHGWNHHSNYECAEWTVETMHAHADAIGFTPGFVGGFKAPGWQISDGCYEALLERGWWVADQHLEDMRRPIDLPVYLYEDGDNWHGHVQNVCGNGIAETWKTLCERVASAESFEFASERVKTLAAA